ncbi:MAG: MBL fold metallo-hydrolase [Archaeoglobaceae archaeon]|nr:MBL fold metallo-hydrolase [Archaeoglobaceae archaeon]MDW8127906.1 MBL fold metallo-hydrolase [Archaeoglobaceae archaeon]
MIIQLLGTGDSPGTPVLNCHCKTCEDARRNRWERKRYSILVKSAGKVILIDTSPDLRRQLLDNSIEKVDAVIWTHSHFDHFGGFSEFYRVQGNVDVYTTPQIHESIGKYLHFLSYKRREVNTFEKFTISDLSFTLFPVNHPPVEAVGIRIEWNGYRVVISGDTNIEIPEKSIEEMEKPDLFVVNSIAPSGKFKKHMNAREALYLAERIGAKKVVLSHLGHFFPPPKDASRYYPVGEDYQLFSFGEGKLNEFIGD